MSPSTLFKVAAKALCLCENSEASLFWPAQLLYYAAFPVHTSHNKWTLTRARCLVLGELFHVHWTEDVVSWGEKTFRSDSRNIPYPAFFIKGKKIDQKNQCLEKKLCIQNFLGRKGYSVPWSCNNPRASFSRFKKIFFGYIIFSTLQH